MSINDKPYLISRALTLIHSIPISRTRRFWEGLENGKIYGTKCVNCKLLYYPPQADCPKCMKNNMEWIELSRRGVLETYSASYLKPQGFDKHETPYIIGIARLPENVRVMGILTGVDVDNVKIGMEVEIYTGRDEEGFYTIYFKPTI